MRTSLSPKWRAEIGERSPQAAADAVVESATNGPGICMDPTNLAELIDTYSADVQADISVLLEDDCISLAESNRFFDKHPEVIAN